MSEEGGEKKSFQEPNVGGAGAEGGGGKMTEREKGLSGISTRGSGADGIKGNMPS